MILATEKPNFSKSCPAGADAPKLFIPITSSANLYHSKPRAASIAIFFVSGLIIESMYALSCSMKRSKHGTDTTFTGTSLSLSFALTSSASSTYEPLAISVITAFSSLARR